MAQRRYYASQARTRTQPPRTGDMGDYAANWQGEPQHPMNAYSQSESERRNYQTTDSVPQKTGPFPEASSMPPQ
ncbi:hypothetical protein VCV18_008988 [Metarhizium anisopliae]